VQVRARHLLRHALPPAQSRRELLQPLAAATDLFSASTFTGSRSFRTVTHVDCREPLGGSAADTKGGAVAVRVAQRWRCQ
jgi:hypothetical protein